MKNIGYLLLAGGFLAGAYATALDVEQVNWMLFGIATAAAAVGLLIAKQQASAHAKSGDVLAANRGELFESIQQIVSNLDEMTNAADLKGAALRERIDLKLRDDLRRFAEARESMVHLFGLQSYADIMSSFAAGERYVNRVWSASADGYDHEAAAYLSKAARQFAEAQRQLSDVSEMAL